MVVKSITAGLRLVKEFTWFCVFNTTMTILSMLSLIPKTEGFVLNTLIPRWNYFLNMSIAEYQRTTKEGDQAPNPRLYRLSDGQPCQLYDVAKKGRPLVLNFGSCT